MIISCLEEMLIKWILLENLLQDQTNIFKKMLALQSQLGCGGLVPPGRAYQGGFWVFLYLIIEVHKVPLRYKLTLNK